MSDHCCCASSFKPILMHMLTRILLSQCFIALAYTHDHANTHAEMHINDEPTEKANGYSMRESEDAGEGSPLPESHSEKPGLNHALPFNRTYANTSMAEASPWSRICYNPGCAEPASTNCACTPTGVAYANAREWQ